MTNNTPGSERTPKGTSTDDWQPWQNFLMGFLVGALLSFVGLSISMDMTHTALADVSLVMGVSAIALPFCLGGLGLMFKQTFLKALSNLMNLLPY
ncbi:MAG: hypothetical protein AAF703_18845 [Cyanobacteria bacterium P01_D01_bin.105]